MKIDYYMNCETGEITENQRAAVEWLRSGVRVCCVATNGRRVYWEPFEK